MNAQQKWDQANLVRKLGRLLHERDRYGNVKGPDTDDLDYRIRLGQKELFEFHAAIVKHGGCTQAKPKRKVRATKQSNLSTEPTHVLPSDQ